MGKRVKMGSRVKMRSRVKRSNKRTKRRQRRNVSRKMTRKMNRKRTRRMKRTRKMTKRNKIKGGSGCSSLFGSCCGATGVSVKQSAHLLYRRGLDEISAGKTKAAQETLMHAQASCPTPQLEGKINTTLKSLLEKEAEQKKCAEKAAEEAAKVVRDNEDNDCLMDRHFNTEEVVSALRGQNQDQGTY